MDDLERRRVGVVDARLLQCELVLDDLQPRAPWHGVTEQAVEPGALRVRDDNLHGRDPARLHGGDEVRPGREGDVGRAQTPAAPHRRGSGPGRRRSISLICSRTMRNRIISRRSSARVFSGSGVPSAVRRPSSLSSALRSVGLKVRIPKRASIAFIRFTRRVRSPTSFSCSRLGRLASSSSIVGIAAMLQWRSSPRNQPRKARISSSVSRRSVFARRCSRETATLEGWMT